MTQLVDLMVLPRAESMLACLQETVADLAKPPADVMLRVGNQVELLMSLNQNECCSGLGWVRVAGIWPSSGAAFPEPDALADKCGPLRYAAQLELGIARCAPTTDIRTIPTADQWNEVTATVLDDAAAMRRAVCCWTDLNKDALHLIGAWQPLLVQGGCLGGTMTVTVATPACDCEDDA